MKTQVITVTNQKGGTGKTTATLFLTAGLSARGKKVLMIDLDQQADATFTMHTKYDRNKTTFDLFNGTESLKDIITPASSSLTVDFAPASPELAQLDTILTHIPQRQNLLKNALKDVEGEYDYVIIDTPPALNIAVINALVASNSVIVPTQADQYGLKGLVALYQEVNAVKRKYNRKLKITGILLERYDPRTIYAQTATKAFEKLAKKFHTKVFKARIREAVAVRESQNEFKPLQEYDPRGKVTKDVNDFINEVIKGE